MRKSWTILFAALLAGVAAFYATRWQAGARIGHSQGIALEAMPELEWLKRDLQLTDAQLSEVRKLHRAYRPKCVEMCRRIADAHEKVETIAAANREITPEYKSALAARAAVHLECQEAMLQHLYETAATLDQEQGRRYLKTMLPYALDYSPGESGILHAQ